MAVITLEGVLAEQRDLRSSPPTKWGRMLYDALHSQFRVVFVSASNESDVRDWLRREVWERPDGIMSWIGAGGFPDYEQWRLLQLRDFLAEGWEIGFFVDTDHTLVTAADAMGIRTLLVSYPAITSWAKPPEEAPRAWDEVVDTIERKTFVIREG